ncbi:MAG: antirestriction protein ArdA, partial [[Clostridium] innocuum]
MEELRVLIEATIPKNGEFPSAWFDLPIDETEFEELLGVEADSEDYRIVEMELPFADDVSEATTVDTLNDLYRMYENLPAEIREELPAFMAYYSNLDELHNYRHDII